MAWKCERVATLDDPRSIGDALKSSKPGEFWIYQVGDYRIIASVEDDALLISHTQARHSTHA